MKNIKHLIFSTTTLISLASCSSDPEPVKVVEPIKPTASAPVPPPPVNQAEALKIDIKKIDLFAHVNRLSSSVSQYTEDDQLIADAIAEKAPSSQSLEEAVLVVSSIHESISGQSTAPDFQETDLYNKNKPKNEQQNTYYEENKALEKIAKRRGVNVPLALKNNLFLQNIQIAKLLSKALLSSHNSKEFREAINKELKFHIDAWGDLAQQLNESDSSQGNNEEQEPQQEVVELGNRNDEQLIQDAASAASQNKYSTAIKTLALIKPQSTLYLNAQEKSKEYSNNAVRELRQKAAQAYQNALAMSDQKAKISYLNNAKKLLEHALDEFPNADQISTVKENLSVINKDLLQISKK